MHKLIVDSILDFNYWNRSNIRFRVSKSTRLFDFEYWNRIENLTILWKLDRIELNRQEIDLDVNITKITNTIVSLYEFETIHFIIQHFYSLRTHWTLNLIKCIIYSLFFDRMQYALSLCITLLYYFVTTMKMTIIITMTNDNDNNDDNNIKICIEY